VIWRRQGLLDIGGVLLQVDTFTASDMLRQEESVFYSQCLLCCTKVSAAVGRNREKDVRPEVQPAVLQNLLQFAVRLTALLLPSLPTGKASTVQNCGQRCQLLSAAACHRC
jgi:hypothetical protein